MRDLSDRFGGKTSVLRIASQKDNFTAVLIGDAQVLILFQQSDMPGPVPETGESVRKLRHTLFIQEEVSDGILAPVGCIKMAPVTGNSKSCLYD